MKAGFLKTCLLLLAAVFLLATYAGAADTFSVTTPAGTEVAMGDADAVLPFTVFNNAGSTKDIREITFKIDTTKYTLSTATVPPSGWCIKDVGTDNIVFALIQGSGACSSGSTASRITPGGSLVFNITVLPLSASADATADTLTSVTVNTQGGFTRTGALPTWTRRSFEAVLTATPESTGTGSSITLTMQVTNRSNATQSTINSTPAPPSPSTAIVTNTAGPYYGSTALDGDHTSAATVINAGTTTEFPSSGTIRIDSEDICYTGKTATSFTGITRGCNATTAAAHTSGAAVYNRVAFSLAAGASGTITWIYSADSTGSVYFGARATNNSATAQSASTNSNTVIIGNFTASLTLTPESVITGQKVTVTMTVQNNGTSALVDVTPAPLTACAGGAAETLFSGPSPSSISSLGSGSTGTFSWQYTITGSIGQVYCLSGYASASGGLNSNSSTSNSGTVSRYSATVAPATIASGAVNQTFTWTVYNGGACTLKEVDITTPAAGGNWSCLSVTPPASWSASCSGTVQFKSSSSANDIPSGGTKSFSITFSATETVTSDKIIEFPVLPVSRGGCGGSEGTIGSYVTVSAYGLTLSHSPAGPIYADGNSIYTMTATLASGGTPVSGKTVSFSTTNGSLSPATAVTDINGQASVSLIAPNSTPNTSAVVTAAYINATVTDTVSFNGWNKANLQYWGSLSPVSVNCGSAYSFTMSIKNTSATTSMTANTGSYFAFNDYSGGGSSVYQAYLDAAATIAPGITQTLTFGSSTSSGGGGGVTLPSTFLAGTYSPTLNSSPPPASGIFFTDGGTNDQYRTVTDNVTVGGSCGSVTVNIIEWHELR
ncbi:MAG: Ig-like domain-containing protein [Deltaproteobacteria bacterium]|nr:Ig-like domain-containing protein [Deltaproteobacteria bacterium]